MAMIRILGNGSYNAASAYYASVAGLDALLNGQSVVPAAPTIASSGDYSASYAAAYARNATPTLYWFSSVMTAANLTCWIACSVLDVPDTVVFRPGRAHCFLGFRNAVVQFSRDTTTGSDGTWEAIAPAFDQAVMPSGTQAVPETVVRCSPYLSRESLASVAICAITTGGRGF